jgi:cytoskeletal protein CcmA (bactofilin family)
MAAQPTESITVLGPDASFKGELTLRGAAKILGEFEGSITAAGEIHIGQQAECNATIEADTIMVDGTVHGDLIARERLQLTNKARVQGDVSAAALIVAEGASFVGRCAVGPDAVSTARGDRTAGTITHGGSTTNGMTGGPAMPAIESKPVRLRATGTNGDQGPSGEWTNGLPAKPAWMAGAQD